MAHKKLKLLYIARFLMEQTDEEHPAAVREIIDYLARQGIPAERKAVYDDLELLESFGMDIVRVRGRTFGLYLGSRSFELPELKMLVDVVQASPFLTQRKSLQLIGKLESLASRHQAGRLRRQVYVMNRIKTDNEQLYYQIDGIDEAIRTDRKVTFRYFDWDVDGGRTFRRGGDVYLVNPVALCVERNYYLVAYEEQRGYVHYRVDRLCGLRISDQRRDALPAGFDLAEYVKGIFDMYRGESALVTLEMDRKLLNAAVDRFGREAHIRPGGPDKAVVTARVEVSPTFLGWVMSFGGAVRILSPEDVRLRLARQCRAVLESCGERE